MMNKLVALNSTFCMLFFLEQMETLSLKTRTESCINSNRSQ